MPAVLHASRLNLLALAFALAACAPGACASIEPASVPMPETDRVYGGVQAHLTSAGFQNALGLVPDLASAMPSTVPIPVPSSQISIAGIDAMLCASGCTLFADLGDPAIDRAPPAEALITVPVAIRGSLVLTGSVSCSIDVAAGLSATADASFGPDSVTHNLGARLTSVSVPMQASDFTLTPQGCPDGLDVGGIADALAAARPQLEQQVLSDAAPRFEQLFCLSCDTYAAGCPEGSSCGADGYCRDGANACLFFPIGVLGAAELSRELPIFQGKVRAELQVVAGQRESGAANPLVDPNMGVVFRLYGGIESPESLPPCVPTGTNPLREPAAIDLEAEAAKIEALAAGYHLGIALTEPFLTRVAESFYARGGLCLTVDRSLSQALTADSLITLLPSLELFAPRGAPALVDIRAKAPPRVVVGKGEYAMVDGKRVLVDPLATLVVDSLEISVYTVVEERLARVLAVQAELSVPLGVEVAYDALGYQQIVPVLGSMADAARNVQVTYNPILAESDETIAQAITALVGLAQLAFDGGLEGFSLEPVNGMSFDVRAIHGVMERPEGDHEAIGIYLNLVPTALP